jgi:hypothetical protein
VERFGIIFTSLLFFSMTLSGLEVHSTHPKPEKFNFVRENFDSIGNLVTRDTFRAEITSIETPEGEMVMLDDSSNNFYRHFVIRSKEISEYCFEKAPKSQTGWFILPSTGVLVRSTRDSLLKGYHKKPQIDMRNFEFLGDTVIFVNETAKKVKHYEFSDEGTNMDVDSSSFKLPGVDTLIQRFHYIKKLINHKEALVNPGVQLSLYISDSPPYLIRESLTLGFLSRPIPNMPYTLVRLI